MRGGGRCGVHKITRSLGGVGRRGVGFLVRDDLIGIFW